MEGHFRNPEPAIEGVSIATIDIENYRGKGIAHNPFGNFNL